MKNINAVSILWFDEADSKKHTDRQKERFDNADIVTGSRSDHFFERHGDTLITRKTSNSAVSLTVNFEGLNILTPLLDVSVLMPGSYVA